MMFSYICIVKAYTSATSIKVKTRTERLLYVTRGILGSCVCSTPIEQRHDRRGTRTWQKQRETPSHVEMRDLHRTTRSTQKSNAVLPHIRKGHLEGPCTPSHLACVALQVSSGDIRFREHPQRRVDIPTIHTNSQIYQMQYFP